MEASYAIIHLISKLFLSFQAQYKLYLLDWEMYQVIPRNYKIFILTINLTIHVLCGRVCKDIIFLI